MRPFFLSFLIALGQSVFAVDIKLRANPEGVGYDILVVNGEAAPTSFKSATLEVKHTLYGNVILPLFESDAVTIPANSTHTFNLKKWPTELNGARGLELTWIEKTQSKEHAVRRRDLVHISCPDVKVPQPKEEPGQLLIFLPGGEHVRLTNELGVAIAPHKVYSRPFSFVSKEVKVGGGFRYCLRDEKEVVIYDSEFPILADPKIDAIALVDPNESQYFLPKAPEYALYSNWLSLFNVVTQQKKGFKVIRKVKIKEIYSLWRTRLCGFTLVDTPFNEETELAFKAVHPLLVILEPVSIGQSKPEQYCPPSLILGGGWHFSRIFSPKSMEEEFPKMSKKQRDRLVRGTYGVGWSVRELVWTRGYPTELESAESLEQRALGEQGTTWHYGTFGVYWSDTLTLKKGKVTHIETLRSP